MIVMYKMLHYNTIFWPVSLFIMFITGKEYKGGECYLFNPDYPSS